MDHGIKYLDLSPCVLRNWVPAYAGSQLALDWCPIHGDLLTLIPLAFSTTETGDKG